MERHGDVPRPDQTSDSGELTLAATPAAPVLDLDGFNWRLATAADAPAFDELASCGANRTIFNLPASTDDFAVRVGGAGLRMPMLGMRGTQVAGAAAFGARSHRDLHALLVGFFREPSAAVLPVATYVRHVFWSLPLRRLHVQLPLIDGADEYVSLFGRIGFVDEGILQGHALIDGQPCNVAVLGILRPEFEAWCQNHERRLLF